MTTGMTVLVWLACAWMVTVFVAAVVAVHRIRRDHKENR